MFLRTNSLLQYASTYHGAGVPSHYGPALHGPEQLLAGPDDGLFDGIDFRERRAAARHPGQQLLPQRFLVLLHLVGQIAEQHKHITTCYKNLFINSL